MRKRRLSLELYALGNTHLWGIDSFVRDGAIRSRSFSLQRTTISELPSEPKFDMIIFGDSFEHIAGQHDALVDARRLLEPDGVLRCSVPCASSFAWEYYRTDWVQLDAPRNLFLHTPQSLDIAARNTSFKLVKGVDDSKEFNFVGREQYRISLLATNSWYISRRQSIVTEDQVSEFEERSRELNRQNRGDLVTAYLRLL